MPQPLGSRFVFGGSIPFFTRAPAPTLAHWPPYVPPQSPTNLLGSVLKPFKLGILGV